MSSPEYWPVYRSTPFRMLVQMIEGYAIHPPLDTPPERIREFDTAILELRLLGWPVLSRPCNDSAIGLKFELPDKIRFHAIDTIQSMANENTGESL